MHDRAGATLNVFGIQSVEANKEQETDRPPECR